MGKTWSGLDEDQESSMNQTQSSLQKYLFNQKEKKENSSITVNKSAANIICDSG